MPIIKILPHPEYCPQGAQVEAPAGTSICEALLEHGIEIEHACEMVAACTTCHVVVREGFNSLGEMDEVEEDLLDRAWGLEPTSRLSCQAILSQQDVTVEIPKYSINHAKETLATKGSPAFRRRPLKGGPRGDMAFASLVPQVYCKRRAAPRPG